MAHNRMTTIMKKKAAKHTNPEPIFHRSTSTTKRPRAVARKPKSDPRAWTYLGVIRIRGVDYFVFEDENGKWHYVRVR